MALSQQPQGKGKGAGIAHILRALGSYQGGKQASKKEKENQEIDQQEMARLLSESSPGFEGPPSQNYQSPQAQALNFNRKMKGQDDELSHNRAKEIAGLKGKNSGYPSYQFLPTADGFSVGDRRTGKINSPEGSPVRSADDPTLQGELSSAKAGGRVTGETDATRQLKAPAAIQGLDNILENISWLKDSDGFSSVYGTIEGRLPTFMPETVDAEAKVNQLTSFLAIENREAMKGSGAISDFEAKTLAQAASVLSDKTISDELATEELDKVFGILSGVKTKQQGYLGGSQVGKYQVTVE